MKIALAQINTTVGDINSNVDKIWQFAKVAKEKQANLIIFPELAICGYPPGDLLLRGSFVRANLLALDKLKERLFTLKLPTIVGFVDKNKGRGRPLFNACAFIDDNEIKVKQYKTLLPTYDVFDEDRYFQPANNYHCASLGKYQFGLTICEDAWSCDEAWANDDRHGIYLHGIHSRYFVDPIEQVANLKPNFIVNIAASPFAIGKHKLRESLLRHHASRWKTPIIFVNQVGGDDELVFDGRSFVVDGLGHMVASALPFEEDLLLVDIDESSNRISGPHKLKKRPRQARNLSSPSFRNARLY